MDLLLHKNNLIFRYTYEEEVQRGSPNPYLIMIWFVSQQDFHIDV